MGAYLSLSGRGWGGVGHLFEAGRLLTFSAFRMGAYSRRALIRGWTLIRIKTVNVICLYMHSFNSICLQGKKRPFIFQNYSEK